MPRASGTVSVLTGTGERELAEESSHGGRRGAGKGFLTEGIACSIIENYIRKY